MNFQNISKQRLFILGAALAGAISLFLPWITVSMGGGSDPNGVGSMISDLAEGALGKSALSQSLNGMHGAGVIIFIGFLGAGILAFIGDQGRQLEKTNWLIVLAAGALTLLLTIIALANTPGGMGFVKSGPGWGAWIGLAASLGVIGFIWLFKRPEDNLKSSFDQLKANFSPAGMGGGPVSSLPSANQTATSRTPPEKMEQLMKLIELKSQGKISEEEYQELKEKLL